MGDHGEPKASKKLSRSKQKNHIQEDFNLTIDFNENGGDEVYWMKKIKESFENDLPNLNRNSGARLPNAPKNLENGDFGLKFQLNGLRE